MLLPLRAGSSGRLHYSGAPLRRRCAWSTALHALLLLVAISAVSAKPMWNEVNKYQANGDLCPPKTRQSMACPAICVYELSSCPNEVVCPDNQQLCKDGKCHDSCTAEIDATNPCTCKWNTAVLPSAAKDLIPCPLLANVTIANLYSFNSTDTVFDACVASAELSNNNDYGIWGTNWPRQSASDSGFLGVWAKCPKSRAPQRMYTFREPMWIATFTVLFGYVGLLAIWYSFKLIHERGFRSSPSDESSKSAGSPAEKTQLKSSGGSDAESDDDDTSFDSDNTRLTGYRNNIFGTAMTWLLLALGFVWLIWLFVLTADYYGSLPPGRTDKRSCVLSYDDCVLGNQTFIFLWCFFVFMVVTVTVYRFRLRNFFRLRAAPIDGHFVCVEHRVEAQIMLQSERSVLVDNVRYMATIFKHFVGWDWNVTTVPMKLTAQGRKYFTYQCTRFVFDDEAGQFAPFSFELGRTNADYVAKHTGLTAEEAEYRAELLGSNFIEVAVPNWFFAFLREMTSFISLYQTLALLLFYYDFYWQVGLVDTGIILLSMTFKVAVRKLSEERLKRMAEQDDMVNVRRNGDWMQMSSRDLVPGDVIQLTTGMHMSCDCILVSGNAVVNESSLTGEPLPVRKFPVRIDDTPFSVEANKNNQLYAGTVISQVQPVETSAGDFLTDQHVLGLVHRTGTASDKGKLVRKILFPQPLSFIFNEQLKVVFMILLIYTLAICLTFAVYFYQGSPVATWFYFSFCGMQAISPLLPAGLVAGQSMAAYRLKKKRIFCVDPQRIMMAGKVQIFCFDKTGTLTKEGLEFYGGQCVDSGSFSGFENALPGTSTLFQQAVASCHAVTDLNGQLIGNPVDIEQFRASNSTIDPAPKYLDTIIPADGSILGKLHVVRRFEFVHARASMSVVVLDETTGKMHVFVKGSFERIKAAANSQSIPADYDKTCANLAREGCYVLSIAHKELDITLEKLKNLTQDEIEGNCDLIGLLVFKNLLKEDTGDAIAELKRGSTRTVMITGDTALTGVYIARQCGMVPPNNKVLLGDIDKKSRMLVWTDVDTDEQVLDIAPFMAELGPDGYPTTELALTSAAFQHMDSTGELAPILLNTRIFARMKPNDKVRCVQLHMSHGITAMCGDGGNDCGALRAAHVGLALSDAEASIVSPFSSSNRSIFSCVELLIQSRAGLTTSFANYRALILYGTTMTMGKLISFYHADSMSQPIWMVIDSLIATSMAITVTFLPPAKKLSPFRPTARLLGPEILSSVIGVVLINWIFMACVWAWTYQQSWFRCHEFDSSSSDLMKWYLLGDNYEAAIMTYVLIYQFINNGFLVNYGYRHRRAWYYNPALLAMFALLMILFSYAELGPPSRLSCTFRLNCGNPDEIVAQGFKRPTWSIEEYQSPNGHNILPNDFKWKLWGYSLGNMLASNLWQIVVVYGPVRTWLQKKRPLRRLKLKL